jgi:rRNA-processing protein FCF1
MERMADGGRVNLVKVIFDSSILMAVVENPTTWFEDIVEEVGKFEPILLDCVRRELEELARGEGKKALLARVSLELAAEFKDAPCGGAKVDDEIMSSAKTWSAMVATSDSELADSLRGSHVRVISLRARRVNVE